MSAKSNRSRLDQLMVERQLAPSRTKAAALIMAGVVTVDGQPAAKAGQSVKESAVVTVASPAAYVSRGGDKLASVATALDLDFDGRRVLDVGAAAGGFSDYALKHGASSVVAVDVGSAQLDWRLRQDPRVEVWEQTDIRDFEPVSPPADLAVVDVSFVSVLKVLSAVWRQVKPDGQVVVMVKPQFEAEKAVADRFKGVITDEAVRQQILAGVRSELARDYRILAEADSAVLGPKGNRERFFVLTKR